MINQSNGGWNKFVPQKKGKYDKYENQLVIIVSRGKHSRSVYLTERVMETLKNPEYIEVYTRGSNIGFAKCEKKGDGYTVQHVLDEHGKKAGMPYLTMSSIINQYNLMSGVYDAHFEAGGIVVFDTQSKPSQV